jgi:hypothetical protein
MITFPYPCSTHRQGPVLIKGEPHLQCWGCWIEWRLMPEPVEVEAEPEPLLVDVATRAWMPRIPKWDRDSTYYGDGKEAVG